MIVQPYFAGTGPRVTGASEDGLTNESGIAAESRWGELLAAAQRGDAGAYRLFLASITPFVHGIARRRTGSEDGAADIVQDVLLTVHRVRHTYEPGRPVKPWLAAIAVRRSIDAMRRRGRIGAREVHNEPAYETYADPQANRQEAGDPTRTLAQMTGGLSKGQKEALELVKLKEMSLAEASAASGQSVASLKVNIHRAIKKMRLMLPKDPHG
ncbi:MAG: sigma-70 family RNA polymerase sigma factor [Pseudomonadota bacterium]|nr:sigma-70 family RNA polymerase sigma factor [Pseudomonadota bacterium]